MIAITPQDYRIATAVCGFTHEDFVAHCQRARRWGLWLNSRVAESPIGSVYPPESVLVTAEELAELMKSSENYEEIEEDAIRVFRAWYGFYQEFDALLAEGEEFDLGPLMIKHLAGTPGTYSSQGGSE